LSGCAKLGSRGKLAVDLQARFALSARRQPRVLLAPVAGESRKRRVVTSRGVRATLAAWRQSCLLVEEAGVLFTLLSGVSQAAGPSRGRTVGDDAACIAQ
jgi:hypothetical protein